MMGGIGPTLGGMVLPLTITMKMTMMVNMQGQHAAMGLAQDVDNGRAIRLRKRDRRTEDAERIGGDQQSGSPAP